MPHHTCSTIGAVLIGVLACTPVATADRPADSLVANQALEWNQIFIDTLIATNTANAFSQRLGAIVHSAMFDAYNGIERRHTPIHEERTAPRGASRRAAVVAAAYTTLAQLFPTRQADLELIYCGVAGGAQRR